MSDAHDYTQYPQASDVQAVLTTTGIALPSTLDYQGAADGASAEWERLTGWRPFLAGPPETRFFDPPRFGPQAGRPMSAQGGRILEIEAGLVQLPDDGLLIGFVPSTLDQVGIMDGLTDASGSAGEVLTRGIQYYLKPNNAVARGFCYTHIEFPSPTRGIDISIVLRNAVFGRTSKLMPDVWMAICRKAVAELVPEISPTISGGRTAAKTTDLQYVFADGSTDFPLAKQAEVWQAKFLALVRTYKRVVV